MLEKRRQNCSKNPELSQKPESFHLYKKVYHDRKPLRSKYLPTVEVFSDCFLGSSMLLYRNKNVHILSGSLLTHYLNC